MSRLGLFGFITELRKGDLQAYVGSHQMKTDTLISLFQAATSQTSLGYDLRFTLILLPRRETSHAM